MSETTTRGVRITVRPRFVPEQSDPDNGQWLFAYHVTIRNQGEQPVQLVSRHWVITNGEGQVDEVRGANHRKRIRFLQTRRLYDWLLEKPHTASELPPCP